MIDERRLFQVLGQRIRQLRESQPPGGARLTQAELAGMVGLERTSITNIERGNQKLPLPTLYRICEALKVSVVDVIPSVAEAQSSTSAKMEELSFASETLETTPLVKQAVLNVLNRSS